jgi:hypothetical protein
MRGVDEPAAEGAARPALGVARSGDAVPAERASTSTVRPYVLTRGRTRSRWHLRWETLVSISHREPAPAVPEQAFDEERLAVELCAYPRSVAEVAAHLKIPVGVTRVVLGDLAERHVIVVHDPGDTADPEILHRIIERLREL